MGKFTYRLPIIHVDSNFERHCETANGPLRFSMQLLTVLYRYTHVHTAQCVVCKVYFSAQPNNLKLILNFQNTILFNIYLSQLVRVRGKNTFLSFSDFQTLDL